MSDIIKLVATIYACSENELCEAENQRQSNVLAKIAEAMERLKALGDK